MALHTRQPMYDMATGIETTHISRVSKMVSNYTGIPVQPNKAIVGANAFAHEAGIHQDGMLKNNQTYEIMRPEMVGVSQSRLVLGKHSGRHAFKKRMKELGYNLDEESIDRMFERFKMLADKKKIITDTDLEALLSDTIFQPRRSLLWMGCRWFVERWACPPRPSACAGRMDSCVVQFSGWHRSG